MKRFHYFSLPAILLLLLPLLNSCSKDKDIEQKQDLPKELANTKKLYDIVKSNNKNELNLRDDISFTAQQSIDELEILYSYAYGDYHVVSLNTYNYTDTVTLTLQSNPVDGSAFTKLTNDVLAVCASQVGRITETGTKYFYALELNILSQTGNNISLSIGGLYGTNAGPTQPTGPSWPYKGNLGGYHRDDKDCQGNNAPGQYQAPAKIMQAVNAARPYINPIIGISQGQQIVITGQIQLLGNTREVWPGTTPDFVGRWHTLMNSVNPLDITPNDCTTDNNCFKLAGHNNLVNAYNCINSAPSKCIQNGEAENYYNRFLYSTLDCMSFYNKNYFVGYNRADHWNGYSVCISAPDGQTCYYWWENNIVIANRNIVPSKQDDKVEIPEVIR